MHSYPKSAAEVVKVEWGWEEGRLNKKGTREREGGGGGAAQLGAGLLWAMDQKSGCKVILVKLGLQHTGVICACVYLAQACNMWGAAMDSHTATELAWRSSTNCLHS